MPKVPKTTAASRLGASPRHYRHIAPATTPAGTTPTLDAFWWKGEVSKVHIGPSPKRGRQSGKSSKKVKFYEVAEDSQAPRSEQGPVLPPLPTVPGWTHSGTHKAEGQVQMQAGHSGYSSTPNYAVTGIELVDPSHWSKATGDFSFSGPPYVHAGTKTGPLQRIAPSPSGTTSTHTLGFSGIKIREDAHNESIDLARVEPTLRMPNVVPNASSSIGSGWRMTYASYPDPASYDRASASEGLSSEPHAMQPFDWMHDASNIVQYTECTEQRIAGDDPARSQGQMLMNPEQFIDWLQVGVGRLPDGTGNESNPMDNTYRAEGQVFQMTAIPATPVSQPYIFDAHAYDKLPAIQQAQHPEQTCWACRTSGSVCDGGLGVRCG
ncbi:hypothetical protein OBBRIDRAFT_839742 [Obba rivulosa]|uniref:Uncharacterized protein n=1 Tax=Obba rivulosa TaxID=1052685 RepID=A0A8E2DEY0_9APHY|nr:hypothetical protein OBBRIDRAFT_839742 [Obba rivulosa]